MNPVDRAKRSILMRAVVAAQDLSPGHALRSRVKRALSRPARVELYFAFDDPYAAVAMRPLREVVLRHEAELSLFPLLDRGMPDDPAWDQREHYAIVDARRLARRTGRVLRRTAPIPPEKLDYLARFTQSIKDERKKAAFAEVALEEVWLGERTPEPSELRKVFRRIVGEDAPGHFRECAALDGALVRNHERLARRGHWESPACWVEGEWFFAHERIAQIDELLAKGGF